MIGIGGSDFMRRPYRQAAQSCYGLPGIVGGKHGAM